MKFEDVQLTGSLNITGSFNVPFHTDSVQAIGRLNIDFLKLGIDMIL